MYSQCTDCTVTTNPSGNYTFAANSVVCFTTDTTLGDVTFQDNVKICIAPNVKLTIQNNISSTQSHNLTFEIAGTLQFDNPPTFNADLDINIGEDGILRSGSTGNNNFAFNGNGTNRVTNNGTVEVGVFDFQNESARNIIDNYGTYNIGANINIKGETTFRNNGTINIVANYNNNSTSTYINCGTINSNNGFNLGGGKVINTGFFNITGGPIDLAGASYFENYGTVVSLGTVNMSSSAIFYNEGLSKLATVQPNGGTFKGPNSSSKKGYIYIVDPMNANGSKAGPNLDFTKYTSYNPDVVNGSQGESAIWNGAPVYIDASGNTVTQAVANVTYNCTECPPIQIILDTCPDADGNFPCTKPGSTNGDVEPNTYVGISTLDRNIDGSWATNAQNGFIKLESKTLGFVPTRLTTTQRDELNAEEGMMIWNTTNQCLEFYNGTTWVCGKNKCNP